MMYLEVHSRNGYVKNTCIPYEVDLTYSLYIPVLLYVKYTSYDMI